MVPLPDSYKGERIKAPTGQWKDGLFELFNAGICHPSLWCSLCCTQIAMGQVISRMQLTWVGEPGPISRTQQAFAVVVVLTASFIVYSTCLELANMPYPLDDGIPFITTLRVVGNVLFTAWSIYALCRTRETVRARYQIPEETCEGCEDLCCSVWCGCCVTAQMLRHTGEYETYPGNWFTSTGHPEGTPVVI